MKLEVGMYVRFKDLTNYIENNDVMIDKITFISEAMNGLDETLQIELEKYQEPILKKDIIGEPSFNIIDLIEIGDIVVDNSGRKLEVNLIRVWDDVKEIICNDYNLDDSALTLHNGAIFKILTKESFENNCFRIGDQI